MRRRTRGPVENPWIRPQPKARGRPKRVVLWGAGIVGTSLDDDDRQLKVKAPLRLNEIVTLSGPCQRFVNPVDMGLFGAQVVSSAG